MRLDLHKAALVAAREYLENVRTRGFWLSVLLLPVILVIVIAVPALLYEREAAVRYTVLDDSGWAFPAIHRTIVRDDLDRLVDRLERSDRLQPPAFVTEFYRELPPPGTPQREQLMADLARLISQLETQALNIIEPRTASEHFVHWWLSAPPDLLALVPDASLRRFRYVPTPGADRAALNALLAQNGILGYFVIPDDPVASGEGARYVTRNLTNRDLEVWFSSVATRVVRDRRIREENIDPATADWIQRPVWFQAVHLDAAGAEEEVRLADTLAQWAPVAFVYFLWLSIFSVSQMLLTNTIEEKSNKLVEVLLSSISPIDLMAGKILGIAATGLTIVGCWMAMLALGALGLPALVALPVGLDLVSLMANPAYLVSFVVYFLLGYLFYAALLCGIGSFANNLKEAQNLMMPVQLCLFVPLLVMIPIGRDPGGLLAQTMSWIPPFTPFVMMNRAAQPPDPMTYVLTTLLLVVSIYLALRFAARVFETGILMTGKPPRLRQLLQLVLARRESEDGQPGLRALRHNGKGADG
jgi:ABC-2 type transport system permease protein